MQALSDKQLRQVSQIIRDHHTALLVNTGMSGHVDPADVSRLKVKGLITKAATDYPRLAYEFGVVSSALEEAMARKLNYQEFIKLLTASPRSMTLEERAAVKFIKRSISGRVKGLGDTVDRKIGAVLLHADAALRHRLTQAVRKELVGGIAQRKAVQEIAKSLRDMTNELHRDWTRVVHTELNNAYQEGRAASIRSRHPKGHDPVVFKRSMPGACDYCRLLYYEADGTTPRLFKLSDLTKSGTTNEGRRAGAPRHGLTEWKPVLGSTHPHCNCTLHEMPRGFGFNSKGEMTYVGV